MGMQMGNGKKGPVADINVTPLVDVMLVLLVIFMVTAPMLFSGIERNTDVVYLRADYGLKYEKVAKIIASLKRGGVSNIALVTELEKSN